MPVPPPPPGEDNPDLYIPDIVKQFITHFYNQVIEKVCVSVFVCQWILFMQQLQHYSGVHPSYCLTMYV